MAPKGPVNSAQIEANRNPSANNRSIPNFNNNLINPNQYGFTNKLSTLHPLLRLTESISEGFQKKKSTVEGFLDIQKDHSRVWILGLTFKLITYDIPSPLIHLIHSYLTNRSFRIRAKSPATLQKSIEKFQAEGNTLNKPGTGRPPIFTDREMRIMALNRRFLLGVRTVNSPQSHIVRVYDAGLGKSGVFHSAEWHVGDWLSDGIREAWLMFFIWVVSFKSFLAWLRAERLLSDWMQGTVNINSDWLPRGLSFKLWGGASPVGRAG
ncbi:RNA-directed DNA polymerase from mobile element jockey [Trichonephila clavipes]|nr:RNA-directed DNA polymerase from mobile element jockey [Trichonephila clavipes]